MMADVAASAAASAAGGGSDVRANASLVSVDFDTRVAIIEYLPLWGKLMFCRDFVMRTLLHISVGRLAKKGSYLVMCLCIIFIVYFNFSPIPVAAGSKTWACDRSLAGNAGWNPQGGMDVSYQCCVLSCRGLCKGRSLVQTSPTEYGVSD